MQLKKQGQPLAVAASIRALGESPEEGREQSSGALGAINACGGSDRTAAAAASQAEGGGAATEATNGEPELRKEGERDKCVVLPEHARPSIVAASGEVLEIVADVERLRQSGSSAPPEEDDADHFNFMEDAGTDDCSGAGAEEPSPQEQPGLARGMEAAHMGLDAAVDGRLAPIDRHRAADPAQRAVDAVDARIAAIEQHRHDPPHPVTVALEKWRNMDVKHRAAAGNDDSARAANWNG